MIYDDLGDVLSLLVSGHFRSKRDRDFRLRERMGERECKLNVPEVLDPKPDPRERFGEPVRLDVVAVRSGKLLVGRGRRRLDGLRVLPLWDRTSSASK